MEKKRRNSRSRGDCKKTVALCAGRIFSLDLFSVLRMWTEVILDKSGFDSLILLSLNKFSMDFSEYSLKCNMCFKRTPRYQPGTSSWQNSNDLLTSKGTFIRYFCFSARTLPAENTSRCFLSCADKHIFESLKYLAKFP